MKFATAIVLAVVVSALALLWFATSGGGGGDREEQQHAVPITAAVPVPPSSSSTQSSETLAPSPPPKPRPSSSVSAHQQPSPASSFMFRKDVPSCAINFYRDAQQLHDRLNPHSQSSSSTTFSRFVSQTLMIHYSPLVKRQREMTQMLKQHGVNIDRWILEFDRDNITDAMSDCFHPKSWPGPDVFSAPGSTRKAKRHVFSKPVAPRLIPTQVSVVTKHYFALYLAAQEQEVEDGSGGLSLILEDDVLLRNGFADHLDRILKEAREFQLKKNGKNLQQQTQQQHWPFDVIMIGGCLKMFAYRKRYNADRWSDHLYKKQEARCAHAYLVTPQGARKLLHSLPLTLPIDFQLSSAFREEDATVLWVEPWLAVQGDIDGGCVTKKFYKDCPTMFKRPFPPVFNLSFIEKTKKEF